MNARTDEFIPLLDPLLKTGGEKDAKRRKLRFRPRQTERARRLRANMTNAEQRLWRHLSRRQLGGLKFSRQLPIGPFVCDFFCREAKLVVELDGGQHDLQKHSDSPRSRMLADDGYRVIRFWNHDVLGNIDGVLTAVFGALHSAPPPTQFQVNDAPHRSGQAGGLTDLKLASGRGA